MNSSIATSAPCLARAQSCVLQPGSPRLAAALALLLFACGGDSGASDDQAGASSGGRDAGQGGGGSGDGGSGSGSQGQDGGGSGSGAQGQDGGANAGPAGAGLDAGGWSTRDASAARDASNSSDGSATTN